ncbi:Vps75p [Sugiyamaella lignohabitans]|uniref:Vps75p n=1 Tax=Sugiyamaella lignohabitans TaxID=796027 RepID=A0A167CTR9_9ASCO|nr:Vps75p [Sugiyamaella lignohabitans]ANB12095.1 Vps75p [Sugiyamaella lignohabitans]
MAVKYSTKVLKPVYEERREATRNVPKFWPTVLDSSELLAEYITYEDTEVLDHLVDLYVEWDEDNVKNFTIHWEFSENDFLETNKVSKRFELVEAEKSGEGDDEDDEDAEDSYTSTPVALKWKKGKNLTKPKDGRDTSFFNWFSFSGEGPGDYKGGENIAVIIAEELFPHALKFFADAFSEGDLAEYELDDEEDDDEDDEVEGDAEHEDAPPRKKSKN